MSETVLRGLGPSADAARVEAPSSDAPRAEASADRVLVTPAASALIAKLVSLHGPLMFHQSGGCCDGSAPMCYPLGEFKIGQQDVLLGAIDGCPVYIGGQQFELWKHTQLIIDAVPGRGAGFSLESPEGMRFLTRSRLFTDAENAGLDEPLRGACEWPPPGR